uniref:Major facilitator superfamily (MFS) profile domain-containing protein n=1 Tax=Aegilops tauschii subsp. strangulata TaxID=200361 RepID=A0A453TC91_AEGTS
SMRGAVLVAITAAIGNMLQGVDNATIAGAVMYIKREFHLETQPAVEGLVVATSLIGATIITTFSGPVADIVGRRPMLIASSLLYFLGGLVMLWSPNVYVLLIARLIDGFGVGLAVTLVPVYISETAPPEIRGLLNTFPQFTGSAGMFMAYCMIFTMTLHPGPSWRTMLGVLAGPSLIYLALTVFYLPESPRWLVSKGRMKEARVVLEKLRGREDVSGEMALLVEGLGSAGETEIEEYVVGPADGDQEQRDTVTLYGPEQGLSWVAQPVAGGRGSMLGSALGLGGTGRQGSMFDSMRDPVVALLGSVHERLPGDGGAGSMRGSTLFPNLGSMLSVERRTRRARMTRTTSTCRTTTSRQQRLAAVAVSRRPCCRGRARRWKVRRTPTIHGASLCRGSAVWAAAWTRQAPWASAAAGSWRGSGPRRWAPMA